MRFIIICLMTVLCFSTSFAESREANVNVILEIEPEAGFVPFGEPSLGLQGLIENGFIRVIAQSEPGYPKYSAMNEAMQKARADVWDAVVNAYVSDGLNVRQAIELAPPYKEYKVKDEEKEAFEAMSEEERKEIIETRGKEKKYDFEKYLEIIKECGGGKRTGRFYDAVEKIGYACLEVSKEDFFGAISNENVNIFDQIVYRSEYVPVESHRDIYGGILVDARDSGYVPSLFFRLAADQLTSVYSGVLGHKKIHFAQSIEEAKKIFGENGVRKVLSVAASSTDGDVGVLITPAEADKVAGVLRKDSNIPFVIMYNIIDIETAESVEENTVNIGE